MLKNALDGNDKVPFERWYVFVQEKQRLPALTADPPEEGAGPPLSRVNHLALLQMPAGPGN